jgi:hypothetical protein
MFGRNIDKKKIEIKTRVEHFLFMAFNYFYIGIWFYMKLEDVSEIFPILML